MYTTTSGKNSVKLSLIRTQCICDDYLEAVLKEGVEQFDAVELHGVSRCGDDIEVDDTNPDFFSVYLHLKSGGVDCVGDYGMQRFAELRAREIARILHLPLNTYV